MQLDLFQDDKYSNEKDIKIGKAKVPYCKKLKAWVGPGNKNWPDKKRLFHTEREARKLCEKISKILETEV
jgi:hypothetical protein